MLEKTRLFNWRSKFRALCEEIFHFVNAIDFQLLDALKGGCRLHEIMNY